MGARLQLGCAVSWTAAAVISLSSLAAAQPAPRKDSIVALRGDLEVLRGQLAMLHGRDSQHDVDLAELGRRVAELERRAAAVESLQQAGASTEIAAVRTELYTQIAQLQTQIQELLDSPAPTQVDHEGGFVWTSEDELYQLRIGGHLQSRWSLARAHDDTDAGFALRRARVGLDGTGGHTLGFRVLAELTDPALVEGWLEYNTGSLSVRAGRDRVPYLRSGVMPEHQFAFAERAVVTEAAGWDRDIGVQLRFHPSRSPIQAVVAVANGGPDASADDVPLVAVRTQVTPIGPRPDPGAGDLASSRLSVTLGISAAVDAIAAPEVIGGGAMPITVTTDLDGNGEADRIVTASTGLDLTIRVDGLELAAEGTLRLESYGDLLRVNPQLAQVVGIDPMKAARTYAAGAVDATYMLDPHIMLGARVSGGQVPFLATHGASALPSGRSVLELDAMLGYYRTDTRIVGVTYRQLRWGTRYDDGGDGPVEHAVVVEAQVVL